MMVQGLYRPDSTSRQRQINTLKIFNDNVIEVVQDSEYNVLFKAGIYDFCLRVLLSNDFPNERPILKISPVVVHPWVDQEGEIKSAPGLLNFTVHSDLGRVVQAIIREFERTPPPLTTEQCLSNSSPSVPVRDMENRGKVSPISSYPGLNNFSPPTYHYTSSHLPQSVTLPELNNLSLDDLQFLNESLEAQEEFLEELPQIKEMNKAIDELILQIEELAGAITSGSD
ncbi:vacuolar protein sorting-associated protein 37A isoform X2 [Agrilus planipennis]|uniref:Vacuolar protein sorting-associated protein 37A isoform X2 n=1 Tax=Agrilus planipennis TaxID=224129 RepID=A0A1W4WFX8_AGRPL|nr:vacuolar protein sorting-associated protein 37A isoform X2 [Agrilus planipennis]